MGKLRDQMEMDMRLRRFSPKTIACYLACMKGVAKHFRKSPAELGDEEIRAYLHYLMEERKASQSVLVQTYSALKFFFENTLQKQWNALRIPRCKQRRKLPGVLTREEVKGYGVKSLFLTLPCPFGKNATDGEAPPHPV